jgi:hypothetical protein
MAVHPIGGENVTVTTASGAIRATCWIVGVGKSSLVITLKTFAPLAGGAGAPLPLGDDSRIRDANVFPLTPHQKADANNEGIGAG